MNNHKKTTVTLPPESVNQIDARRGGEAVSMQVNADLEMLWEILVIGLREAKTLLSPTEASLILDVQNGVFISPVAVWIRGGLAHQIEDAIKHDQLDQKWKIDGEKLVEKLTNAPPLVVVALLDWARVFWNSKDKDIEKAISGFTGK